MASNPILVHLDPDTLQGVEEIASRSQIEKEAVIQQALRDYLEVERWRGEHIRESIRQADTGEFADEERIEGIFSKWES
jgi:predicted transcriptional regulator